MTCHDAVASLTRRKLVMTHRDGKKKLYSIGSIDELLYSVKKFFASNAEKTNGKIESKTISDEITIYHGLKNCNSIWKRIADLKKGERAVFVQPNQCISTVLSKLGVSALYPNNDTLNEKGVIVEALLHKSVYKIFYDTLSKLANPKFAQKEIEKVANRTSDIRFIDDKYLNIPTEMMFFRNTAYLINWKDEMAIEIKNKMIINFLYELYELARGYGTKINQSEYVRKIAANIESKLDSSSQSL